VRSTLFLSDFNEEFESFSHSNHVFLWKHQIKYEDPNFNMRCDPDLNSRV
jgi:hypothetical protein